MTTLCLLDNIILPGFLTGLHPRSGVTTRGEEFMKRVGITGLAASDVAEVFGGRLQYAGVYRVLISDPGIVFVDEPTRVLSSVTALQILDLLGEIHTSGTTLVVATHDSQVAARADHAPALMSRQITKGLLLGRYKEADGPPRLTMVIKALQRHSV